MNPIPRVNQKGLLERDLVPKEAYYVVQSYWAERPMVHIYGHSWPTRWGDPGERKLVKAYSNCETVELFLNGVSCGVRSRKTQDFPAAGLRWLVQFPAGENHVRAVGRKLGQTVVDELVFSYQTAKWGPPTRLELRKKNNLNQTVTLEVRLLDANNLLCLDARSVVRFHLAGDGNLMDDLGTSGGSRCLELYNGRAEISLHLNGGKSVATVSSKGLPTAFLLLE
jgi:beta-galactosidase